MSGLNYGTFFEVGDTGLYLGGGREGGFVIAFKENRFFYDTIAIEGCCDCIHSIYEGIKEFAPCSNVTPFLIKYEWLIRETAKKVWEDMEHEYIFPKCFDCKLKKKVTNDNCFLLECTSWSYERPEYTIPEFDVTEHYERVFSFLKWGYDSDIIHGESRVI